MADDERLQGADEAGRAVETRAVQTDLAEAEVAVVREGSLYADAWRHLRDIQYGMSICPQALDDLPVHALIGHKIHATASASG